MNLAASSERAAGLAWLPVLATACFYALPPDLQNHRSLQFLPQLVAYAALALWASRNSGIVARLGLQPEQIGQGLRWGVAAGLILGALNTGIILRIVPWLGFDIAFLLETPHAHIPPAIMLPWFILLIAVCVEVNFRGFVLGRLLALMTGRPSLISPGPGAWLAVGITALVFSFDPFMVVTFRHLHWIAVWDGLVWGLLWVRLRNLYVPIIAHAVEVMVTYSIVRTILT